MPHPTIAQFEIKKIAYIDSKSQLIHPLPDSLTPNVMHSLYHNMRLTRAMDSKAINLQRTGQMSTYPSCCGQEAVSTGIGHAMKKEDVFCPYYRDQGVFLQRGVPISEIYRFWGGDERGNLFANNPEDFPCCVPIAGQYLHATGVAFAMQYRHQARAVVTTGGEGSTSKGDFYEAINLAGAWQLPVVFVINNNQWAISVPIEKQTRSQTIAQKGIAAGIDCLQVDGNDVIAVKEAVEQALSRARSGKGPTLIEAICYRLCDHTTVDDASRYQPQGQVEQAWDEEPIARLKAYMTEQNIWSDAQENELEEKITSQISEAVKTYLSSTPQHPQDLIDYTYASLPESLIDQRDALGEPSCQ